MNKDTERFYKLITETRKKLELTMEDVKFILEHCGYSVKKYDTYYPLADLMRSKKWVSKSKFIQDLNDDGLMYFAYVKFYKKNEQSYALVAGKTKITESYHTDICFTKDEKYIGKAKTWLREQVLNWDSEKLLVVVPENKNNEQEALDIEREITGLLGLFSS